MYDGGCGWPSVSVSGPAASLGQHPDGRPPLPGPRRSAGPFLSTHKNPRLRDSKSRLPSGEKDILDHRPAAATTSIWSLSC